MDTRNKSTMANVVGWLALVVSAIALVVALMAYNNASETNLDQMIRERIQGTVQPQPAQDSLNNDTMNDGTGANDTTTPGADDTMNDGTGTGATDDATMPGDDAVIPEETN